MSLYIKRKARNLLKERLSVEELKNLGLWFEMQDSFHKKREIRRFFIKDKRLPKQHSINEVEKKLGEALSRYCRNTHKCYDKKFQMWAEKNGYRATNTIIKKEIKNFLKKHKRFPSVKNETEKKLGRALGRYCSPSSSTYDKNFSKWAHDNNYANKNKYLQKILNIMPKELKFDKNQVFKSVTDKYIFIHIKHGRFTGIPHNLKKRWKRGLTGHPKESIALSASSKWKQIKCMENDLIFENLKDAAKWANVKSIKMNQKTSGGYHWAYCDSKGKVLK